MSIFTPRTDQRSQSGLKEATDQLIENLKSSNSGMNVVRDQGRIQIGGKPALSKLFSSDSQVGGRETDWLVTVMVPEGLVYCVFVAPEQEFSDYQSTFQQILDSIKFYD